LEKDGLLNIITKNVEFRSYLKPEKKNIVWKKSIPTSWLDEK